MKFISPSLHVFFQSSSLRNADNKTVNPPYLSCSFASLFRCCLKFLLNLSHVEKSEIKLSGKIICDFHNATFLRSYKVFKRALGHQEVNIKCFHWSQRKGSQNQTQMKILECNRTCSSLCVKKTYKCEYIFSC